MIDGLRVLIVEDSPPDARLVELMLEEQAGTTPVVRIVERLSEAIHCLDREPWDVVLLDLGLPDSQGLDTFSDLHRAHPTQTVVVLSGSDDDGTSELAVRQGAQDFLPKADLASEALTRSIRYARERQKLQQTLLELSLEDELTGLYNRRGLMVVGDQLLKLAERQREPVAVIYADLDGFKPLNDTHGHAFGDRVLQAFGAFLHDCCRDSDVVARVGGDEFVVLTLGVGSAVGRRVEEGMAECVAQWAKEWDVPFRLSTSVGLVQSFQCPHPSLEDLLDSADQAMYEVKTPKRDSGRGYAALVV